MEKPNSLYYGRSSWFDSWYFKFELGLKILIMSFSRFFKDHAFMVYGSVIKITTTRKISLFGVRIFLVCIFTHSYWLWRDTEHMSLFSSNVIKYGPEKLRIRTLITQWTALHVRSSQLKTSYGQVNERS